MGKIKSFVLFLLRASILYVLYPTITDANILFYLFLLACLWRLPMAFLFWNSDWLTERNSGGGGSYHRVNYDTSDDYHNTRQARRANPIYNQEVDNYYYNSNNNNNNNF